MRFIERFMVEFGALSSLFDFLAFAVPLGSFHASPEVFRTGWFVASLLTELLVALAVRTRRPFFRSRLPLTFAIPFVPHVAALGFGALPASLLAALAGVTALYVFAAELMKRWFYRRTL